MDQLVEGPRIGRSCWMAASRLEREEGGGAVKITFSVLAWEGDMRERKGRRMERDLVSEDW